MQINPASARATTTLYEFELIGQDQRLPGEPATMRLSASPAAGQHDAFRAASARSATKSFWDSPRRNRDPNPDPNPLPPPVVPYLPNTLLPQLAPPEPVQPFIGSSLRVLGSTWHLSVIDGGFPRSVRAGQTIGQLADSFRMQVASADMKAATWILATHRAIFRPMRSRSPSATQRPCRLPAIGMVTV